MPHRIETDRHRSYRNTEGPQSVKRVSRRPGRRRQQVNQPSERKEPEKVAWRVNAVSASSVIVYFLETGPYWPEAQALTSPEEVKTYERLGATGAIRAAGSHHATSAACRKVP